MARRTRTLAEQVHILPPAPVDTPQTIVDGPEPRLVRIVDRALAVQRPVVLAHLRSLQRRHPGADREELIRLLGRRYLVSVTATGASVGVVAAIPAVGTAATLALSGAETAVFLEATALYAQSVAEVHGLGTDDPVRARALVMTLMLGNEGSDLVRQWAGQAVGGGPRSRYWGELITGAVPSILLGPLTDRLRSAFLRRFAVTGSAGILGRALPFGIGAVVGGVGNRMMGTRVLASAERAFGPLPAGPLELLAAAEPAAADNGAADNDPAADVAR